MLALDEDTTLGLLAIELGKLGITGFVMESEPGHKRAYTVTVKREGFESCDHGQTLAQAFDRAVSRFLHRDAAAKFPPEDT